MLFELYRGQIDLQEFFEILAITGTTSAIFVGFGLLFKRRRAADIIRLEDYNERMAALFEPSER